MSSVSEYIVASFFLTVILLGTCNDVRAQKTTEIFIPVGKSPGISGKYSVMGRVESVRADDHTISVAREGGSVTVKIMPGTSIYLDKSKLKLPNVKGSWADIQPGRMVEVKYKDNQQGGLVEWIKVQLE